MAAMTRFVAVWWTMWPAPGTEPWPNHASKTWVRVLRVCGGALAAAVLLYDEATAQNRSR